MEEDDVTIREQNFHSQVREYIICFLIFAVLYIVSYCIITRYKRKSDDQEDEDAVVNRISLYLCTFTLAVSGGAVFLLPFSIISNEILLSFPKNYYIQWLNGSLIHGLWNLVSLSSNLCLFVLMPFAYFFLESEGFAGSKKLEPSGQGGGGRCLVLALSLTHATDCNRRRRKLINHESLNLDFAQRHILTNPSNEATGCKRFNTAALAPLI